MAGKRYLAGQRWACRHLHRIPPQWDDDLGRLALHRGDGCCLSASFGLCAVVVHLYQRAGWVHTGVELLVSVLHHLGQ